MSELLEVYYYKAEYFLRFQSASKKSELFRSWFQKVIKHALCL